VTESEGKAEAVEHIPGKDNQRTMFLRSVFFIFIFVVILFVPAGRLDWWAGWALLIGFILAVGLLVLWARQNDPALMAERQDSAKAENVKGWDQVIMRIYSVVLLIMLVLASFDAGRMGWSQVPLVVRLIGWLGLVLAFVLVWRVMVENTFLSERVRIQEERGHQVVSTGPYRIIRHPMYAGIILAMFSLPLALGSWWALIPAALIVLRLRIVH